MDEQDGAPVLVGQLLERVHQGVVGLVGITFGFYQSLEPRQRVDDDQLRAVLLNPFMEQFQTAFGKLRPLSHES